MAAGVSGLSAQEFTIIIDTREQVPFTFDNASVEVGTLSSGDYSIKNLEDSIALERKSLSDLCSCICGERERFKRELKRLRSYRCRAVIIEATMEAIYKGKYRSKVTPQSVLGSCASWQTYYETPFVFAGDYGAYFAIAIMRNFFRQLQEFSKTISL